ncbi:PAS domain-containing sensor histidine kinase [Cupriavidus plantarum]|uniref:PAS domain-containing sensor histidine kinase n=1 Tax=Cupriavidus plantarum TaxID=942865 RepID=UPI0015CDB208|nr:PAS domain-containing sensor histidine kinase [Cupriavidus plantarum]NYI00991.1 hypothetical protein [Cupriavidus plantarum]
MHDPARFRQRTLLEWGLLVAVVTLAMAASVRFNWSARVDLAIMDVAIVPRLHAAEEDGGIETVGALWFWCGTLVPVWLAAFAALRLTPRGALISTMVLMGALVGASVAAVAIADVWFAPATGLLGCLLFYPLWSWRRQEAALRFLSAEVERLSREPGLHPVRQSHDRTLDGSMQAVYGMTAQLRDMRRFLADGLESLPEATVICDADGVILVANRRAVALVPAVLSGVNARDPRDSGDGLDPPALPDVIESLFPVPGPGLAYWDALCATLEDHAPVVSSADSQGVELATESDRRYLLHGAPLHGESGRPAGAIVSFIDITAVRRAERQREQTMHFLSHDMRSPQASILALIDLQSRPDRALPEPVLLARIGELAHRTLALADDFIRLAQAESQTLSFTPADLQGLILDATDELWALAKARGVELRLDLEPDCPPLRVVPALLVRAIANLVSNAIKFGPSGHPVTVRLRRGRGHVAIEVADEGPGIARADQGRLFRPFSRVNDAGGEGPSGSGLGLVFVKTVAERHGGRITVNSDVGRGATFAILLPVRGVPTPNDACAIDGQTDGRTDTVN